ncbi:MAG: hypothetical protein P8X74_03785 [Reinekea sp.]
MCDCFKKISELLKEKCLESVKDQVGFQDLTDSGFVNSPCLVLDSDMNQRKTAPFYMPFEIKYTRKAKTTGNVREYKKTIDFFPSHCPICGEKYNEED